MPRKIRQLIADLTSSGFTEVEGGNASHRKFRHENFPGAVIVSGKEGAGALPYQEKHIKNALGKIRP